MKIVVPFYPLIIKGKEDYFKLCRDITNGEIISVEKNDILSIIKKIKNENVHAHSLHFPFPLSCSLFAKKSVCTPHANSIGRRILTRLIRKAVLNKYEKVVALTPFAYNNFLAGGLNKEKLTILPLPVDYKFFSKPKNGRKFRQKYNLNKEPFVLSIGLRLEKNPFVIAKACEKVGIKCVFIGEILKRDFKILHKLLQLKNILITGPLSKKEVLAALDAATIFVNSSRFETFCLSVYEAASAGVPLCLPKIGTFDHFKHTALFHESYDITKLAQNIKLYLEKPNLRKENSRKAKKIAKLFDYNTVRKMYKEFYEEIGFI